MNAKRLMALCALALAATLAVAQKANIVYVEGSAKVKSGSGSLREADIGGTVGYGESVITGRDGLVELTLPNGSSIKLSQNSVFSYSSLGSGSDERPVLATTAGRVSYKLKKATGRSPMIQTNSMVAGVRGTEFTVFAGMDGSVLLAVEGGIVDVEAQGKTVSLVKDEAVEVEPGKAPGAKFVYLGRPLDFSSWNQGRTDDFLADPIAAIDRVARQLEVYRTALANLQKPYEEATVRWRAASAKYKEIVAAGDQDEIKRFQQETLFPAEDERAVLILNIRHHALNYLSMRRYVLSNMYMEMKSRHPLEPTAQAAAFFAKHGEILARYEDGIVPKLNKNDY
jgi:hypothetical protein